MSQRSRTDPCGGALGHRRPYRDRNSFGIPLGYRAERLWLGRAIARCQGSCAGGGWVIGTRRWLPWFPGLRTNSKKAPIRVRSPTPIVISLVVLPAVVFEKLNKFCLGYIERFNGRRFPCLDYKLIKK